MSGVRPFFPLRILLSGHWRCAHGAAGLTFMEQLSSCQVRAKATNCRFNAVFDVADGTLSRLHQSSLKMSNISRIFLSHMHGDHVLGLVAVLKQIMTGVGMTEEQLEELRKQGQNKKVCCPFRDLAVAPKCAQGEASAAGMQLKLRPIFTYTHPPARASSSGSASASALYP